MGDAQRRRWVVSGRVHGVGYRMFVFKSALSSDLRGYVRNLPDGTVEAVAEGSPESMHALETLLKQGPAASRVDSVSVDPAPARTELPYPFEIRS
jgi:acylphosphatase